MRNIIATTLTIVALSIAIGCSSAKEDATKPVSSDPVPTDPVTPTGNFAYVEDLNKIDAVFEKTITANGDYDALSVTMENDAFLSVKPIVRNTYRDDYFDVLSLSEKNPQYRFSFDKGILSEEMLKDFNGSSPIVNQITDQWSWSMASSNTLMIQSPDYEKTVFLNISVAKKGNMFKRELKNYGILEVPTVGDMEFIGISEEPYCDANGNNFSDLKYYWAVSKGDSTPGGNNTSDWEIVYHTHNDPQTKVKVATYPYDMYNQIDKESLRPSWNGGIYWFTSDATKKEIKLHAIDMASGKYVSKVTKALLWKGTNPQLESVTGPAFAMQDGRLLNGYLVYDITKDSWSISNKAFTGFYHSEVPGTTLSIGRKMVNYEVDVLYEQYLISYEKLSYDLFESQVKLTIKDTWLNKTIRDGEDGYTLEYHLPEGVRVESGLMTVNPLNGGEGFRPILVEVDIKKDGKIVGAAVLKDVMAYR